MKQDKIWMKVTLDQYALPVAVADSAQELARLCDTTPAVIYTQMSRDRHGHSKGRCPWVCICVS